MSRLAAYFLGATLALASGAQAAEKIKVGMIVTLSGPPAAIGQQIRNGFELGLEKLGGKIAGRDVEFIVEDDELKPDVAVTKANALVERDDVDFVVGPVFSNILQAIMKPVTDADTILISPNPGTSPFAGKDCNPNFFVTSIQNEVGTEALGKYAVENGIDNIIAIAPNYQAGRDMIAGFKRTYTGAIADEIYVPLNQLDFSSELTRIAVGQTPAIFTFLPGGMGVNFIKQFNQAGLSGKVKILSVFTADEVTLPAQKEAALGVLAGSHWAPNIDNPENKAFVDAYIAKFDAVPATYAANAYDTVMLLDAALTSLNGDASDVDAVRDAIRNAEFKSVRGDFKFNTNHFPIEDIYITEVAKREDGKFQTQVIETPLKAYQDPYVAECSMN